MKRLINYTVLTKTAPEWSKRDGCLYTCSIGYSPEMGGLIRLYPLPLKGMDKWNTYRLEVQRRSQDTRAESWQICSFSRYEGWARLGDDIEHRGVVKPRSVEKYLASIVSPSISALNHARLSIGVIHAKTIGVDWADNPRFSDRAQIPLFEDVGVEVSEARWLEYTKIGKPTVARVRFVDADGQHDLQYNEWHLYRGMEKLGQIDLACFNGKSLLLVGNMYSRRTAWLGLGVYRHPGVVEPSLFREQMP